MRRGRAQTGEITSAAVALRLQTAARMHGVTSSLQRFLLVAAICSLGGCDDEADTCGAESLQLEITPAPACLQLSAMPGTSSGDYQIAGTNNCAEPLVVHYPWTHDGGANETFSAGAQVVIPLSDSEVFNQDTAVKTWTRNAVLGTETIVITLTQQPC